MYYCRKPSTCSHSLWSCCLEYMLSDLLQFRYMTHSKDPIQQPAGQVDCSLLPSDLRRWTSVIVPVEFKLEDSELPTALNNL